MSCNGGVGDLSDAAGSPYATFNKFSFKCPLEKKEEIIRTRVWQLMLKSESMLNMMRIVSRLVI